MKKLILIVSVYSLLSLKAVAAPAADGALKDSQIINVLVNLNNSEINAGRLAKSKAGDKSVKGFAEEMIEGHSQSNIDIKKLSKDLSLKAESDSISDKMKKDSEDKLAELKSEKAPAFDSTYMDAQVSGHQDALKTLDEKLIPNAKSPQLISMLNKTKGVVQNHLDMATKIQSSLKK